MGALIVIAFLALVVWGYWKFYASGLPSADAQPPDLADFSRRPEVAAGDNPSDPPPAPPA